MERYRVMDHTADLMVEAYGRSMQECFSNAGFALFDQTVDLSTVDPSIEVSFSTGGDDLEERLYLFLSELLFMEDCDGFIAKDLDVRFESDKTVCVARGEHLDRDRHRVKSEVKAVTFHMMRVEPDVPRVTVIFDV